jgi:hypothetical protein
MRHRPEASCEPSGDWVPGWRLRAQVSPTPYRVGELCRLRCAGRADGKSCCLMPACRRSDSRDMAHGTEALCSRYQWCVTGLAA